MKQQLPTHTLAQFGYPKAGTTRQTLNAVPALCCPHFSLNRMCC